MKQVLKNIILLCTFLFWGSCFHKEIFFEFHSLKNAEWKREEIAVFQIDISKNTDLYNVSLEIRNNNDYPFQNIWLFIDLTSPSGLVHSDTLNVDLADIYGKWHGKGLSLYCLSIPYKSSAQFTEKGTYTYSIQQGMRQNPLKGISDIGLKISKQFD